jgi:hypothetical protein
MAGVFALDGSSAIEERQRHRPAYPTREGVNWRGCAAPRAQGKTSVCNVRLDAGSRVTAARMPIPCPTRTCTKSPGARLVCQPSARYPVPECDDRRSPPPPIRHPGSTGSSPTSVSAEGGNWVTPENLKLQKSGRGHLRLGAQRSRAQSGEGRLAWFDRESNTRFGKRFHLATNAERTAICDDICYLAKAKSEHPFAAQFFDTIRDQTATAFYTTPQGWKDLGYIGNVAMPTFKGPNAEIRKQIGVA